MHPIEQLRFVARAAGADADLLVGEAAGALSVFRSDPAGLLVASKRLLSRQPAVGPLWWMTTRLLLAADVGRAAQSVVEAMHDDPTPRILAHALPDGATVALAGWPSLTVEALPRRGDVSVLVIDVEGQGHSVVRRLERADVLAEAIDGARVAGVVADADVVVIEAAAAGESAVLVDVGAAGLAAAAHALGCPVWLVAGVGRRLAEPYWRELVQRSIDVDLEPWLRPYEVLGLGLVDRVIEPDGSFTTADWNPTDLPFAAELLGPAI